MKSRTSPRFTYPGMQPAIRPVRFARRVTVAQWEVALLFRDGRVVEVMGAGSRRTFTTRTSVRIVDLRPWVVSLPAQEIPTSEGVTVKVTATAEAHVADPTAFVTGTQDPTAMLYLAIQLALREVLATTTLDDLVGGRADVGTSLLDAVRIDGATGLAIDRIELRDIILPGELKRAQAQVLLARAEGQAALERARSETAALRSLANAARLATDNPALLQLRLLQEIGASSGHTIVIGAPAATPVPIVHEPRSSHD